MFNITVVVFSLVIGALAHKLYLEKKWQRKEENGFEPLLAKGVSQKGIDIMGLQSHLNPRRLH